LIMNTRQLAIGWFILLDTGYVIPDPDPGFAGMTKKQKNNFFRGRETPCQARDRLWSGKRTISAISVALW
jgi:hypothetical protein